MTDPRPGLSPDAARATLALAAFVVKRGVGLGRLAAERRDAALAVAACALASAETLGERDASARLAAWLQGPAAFLETDAAELRRWLVDAGWWTRDGFGRAYRRSPVAALSPQARSWVDALAAAAGEAEPAAVTAWAAGLAADEARRRAARRATAASTAPADTGPPPATARGAAAAARR